MPARCRIGPIAGELEAIERREFQATASARRQAAQ
ncbi:hypothetical protein AvCA_46730 [Azotobacter vinelandii CA]|uniref:Uncharacterized protein n=2 Tax=Azotobacter vinelandii TaxID=354 RepID=C1DIV9_AZOVD|nr:hypothetical protein Avin_46730 [Azotobacter vinelandii DJ]AGK15887.1 hypothetical protein AvCA_46730 [Azotobacter vinelandii CA]AGK22151.1 hypothetical protein AvCA6_46730 [Azotobacter vinelandii CA6]